jgi:predicted alpha/beta hydrolase
MNPIPLLTPDGVTLSGRLFSAEAPRAVVVLASALGVPQPFYARFAGHLASEGFTVLTFDYRGVGDSAQRDLVGDTTTLRHWGEDDVAAAISAAERVADGLPVLLLGIGFSRKRRAVASYKLVPLDEASTWKL